MNLCSKCKNFFFQDSDLSVKWGFKRPFSITYSFFSVGEGFCFTCNDKGFSFSCENDLVKFYRASNSILAAANRPSEKILLQLLYSNCIPTLSYACAVKQFPSRQMQNCNTAVNDALRLIFGYHRWESVRQLREFFGYKSLTDIFGRSRKKFHERLPYHSNSIISCIARNLPDIVED